MLEEDPKTSEDAPGRPPVLSEGVEAPPRREHAVVAQEVRVLGRMHKQMFAVRARRKVPGV